MNYVCLVYGEENYIAALSKEGLAELDRRSVAYDKSIEKAGKLVICQALQSVKTSMTVRKRSGKVVMTDGPFAETKEQLLGFYIVDCPTLEDAVEAARGMVGDIGALEIRPVMLFDPGSGAA